MKLPTRLLAGAAAVLFTTGTAAAATLVADTGLHVRSGPGTQYPVIATIPDGAAVNSSGCRSGWCHVDYRGHVGWASQAYLTGAVARAPTTTYSYAYSEPYFYSQPYYPEPYSYSYGTFGPVFGPTFAFGYYGGHRHFHHRHFHHRQFTGSYAVPRVAHNRFHFRHFTGRHAFPHAAMNRAHFHHFAGRHAHAAMSRSHQPAMGSFRNSMASVHARGSAAGHAGARLGGVHASAAPHAIAAAPRVGGSPGGTHHHR